MSDFFPIPTDGGDIFTPTELAQLRLMRDQLQAKRARNRVRQNYYDQRVGLKDLGISIPPQLRNIDSVLGWPAKTVDVLADRIRFEKFISTQESNTDPFGLNELVAQNDFQEVFAQAASSALINSCAFITLRAILRRASRRFFGCRVALTGLLGCGISASARSPPGCL